VAQVQELAVKKETNTFNQFYGHRFSVGEGSGGKPAAVLDNMTSSVLRAAKVGELIIVFGEIGTDADLITVFDHSGLKKCIWMLCYSPSLSPDGRYIAFRRFFPRTSDLIYIGDRLGVLSIREIGPGATPCLTGKYPPDDLGTNIYPLKPTPGPRFWTPLIWSKESKSLTFLQLLTPDTYILGRSSLNASRWLTTLSPAQLLRVNKNDSSTDQQINSFYQDAASGLFVVETESQHKIGGALRQKVMFDPDTLLPLS
jgi:hypothetical protein